MSDYVIGQVKSAFVYSQVQSKPKGSHPLLKKWSGKIGTMAPIYPALNWIKIASAVKYALGDGIQKLPLK